MGMVLSLGCLAGAFASFGTALYRLYRYGIHAMLRSNAIDSCENLGSLPLE